MLRPSFALLLRPVLLVLGAVSLAGCASLRGPGEARSISIGGSSTVFPIMEAARESFLKQPANAGITIEVEETGTTGGFRRFCDGEIPIGNASRPISSKELEQCARNGVTFIELPIAFDALTVAVNPRNDWVQAITVAELSTMWNAQAEGKIRKWNQVNAAWPDQPLNLCGPGSDSGTWDYFNQAINGSSSDSRKDYTASEDDNVLVRCVANDVDALGYFGFAYYQANTDKLRALAIDNGSGPVLPSKQAVQKTQYVPLSRPLFIYVNHERLVDHKEVRDFLTYTLQNGLRLVKEVNYIPLPDDTYRLVEAKLYRNILGTSFGGDLPVGLSISEALRRSFDETKRPEFR